MNTKTDMKMDDMIMVSVDDHVCEPPDMWDRHLPAKWKDKAPKLIQQNGADLWVYDGRVMPNIGVNAVAGRVPEEYGMEPTALDQMRPGAYNINARIDVEYLCICQPRFVPSEFRLGDTRRSGLRRPRLSRRRGAVRTGLGRSGQLSVFLHRKRRPER